MLPPACQQAPPWTVRSWIFGASFDFASVFAGVRNYGTAARRKWTAALLHLSDGFSAGPFSGPFRAQRGFSGWLLCSTWKNLGFVFERNCYSKNHQRQGFTTQKEVNFWLKGLAHNRRVLSGSDVLKEIQKNTWKTIEKAKRKTSEKGPG